MLFGSRGGGGGTPILDLTGMLVVTLGVEIVDPVTFRVSGRKKSVHLWKNSLSFGDYFQYSCVISMNENFRGTF